MIATNSNCIRLSNNPCFFKSSNRGNINNTYVRISTDNQKNNGWTMQSVTQTIESVVVHICKSGSGTPVMNSKLNTSLQKLKDIENLTADWDGYGTEPFSKSLINKCQDIVRTLSVQPSIYPTGRRSIQMQYELNDRSYLEFEVFENETMCLKVPQRKYSEATEFQLYGSEKTKIKEIVDDFYGRNSTKA